LATNTQSPLHAIVAVSPDGKISDGCPDVSHYLLSAPLSHHFSFTTTSRKDIIEETNLKPLKVTETVALLNEGGTVPSSSGTGREAKGLSIDTAPHGLRDRTVPEESCRLSSGSL
jgi:hypothetical protein